LSKLFLVIIEACDAPCILIRIAVMKKMAISEEIPLRPALKQARG